MSSKNSSNTRDPDRRRRAPKPSASQDGLLSGPGVSDKDRELKLATARCMASAGYYVRTNVVLSEPRSIDGPRSDVTDVDVMAFAYSLDLRTDLTCFSCKSGTRVSVLHETFALAGVMRYLHAHAGYGIFEKKIAEPHMLALAEQLDVTLLDGPEWTEWLRRYSGAAPVPQMLQNDVDAAIARGVQARLDLSPLSRFLQTDYWYYWDHRNIHQVLVRLRKVKESLSDTPLSRYVFLDAVSLLAIAVMGLCKAANTGGLRNLPQIVPAYLFGGSSAYRQRRDLVRAVEALLQKKGVVDPEQGLNLEPPYIDGLVELVFRYCQRPQAAHKVPQHLALLAGVAAAEVARVAPASISSDQIDEYTEKLAMDLIELAGKAAGLSSAIMASLRNLDPRRGGGTDTADSQLPPRGEPGQPGLLGTDD